MRYGLPSFAWLLSSQLSQKTVVNKQMIESLAYRSETLVDLLCEPVSDGDVKEETRRKDLES